MTESEKFTILVARTIIHDVVEHPESFVIKNELPDIEYDADDSGDGYEIPKQSNINLSFLVASSRPTTLIQLLHGDRRFAVFAGNHLIFSEELPHPEEISERGMVFAGLTEIEAIEFLQKNHPQVLDLIVDAAGDGHDNDDGIDDTAFYKKDINDEGLGL